jgi:phage replication O-like protein O
LANPQAENGHTDIANELAEALALTYLSATESRLLWVIARKTWGWKKKLDRISYSQFEQATGLDRRHIAPALKRLISRNIIMQTGNGQVLEYGIQKDYEKWQSVTQTGNAALRKNVTAATVTQTRNAPLLKKVTPPLPEAVTTKESKYILPDIPENDDVRELQAQFGDLDFDTELVKFRLYWSEGGRQLKRPGLALLNWMLKAREFKKRDSAAPARVWKPHPAVASDDELDRQEVQQGIRR